MKPRQLAPVSLAALALSACSGSSGRVGLLVVGALTFGGVCAGAAVWWRQRRRSGAKQVEPGRGAAPLPTPAIPVSLRPPSAEVMATAKDFEDGAATVLVPKMSAPAVPRELLEKPKISYQGERFGLGHVASGFGIWYLHQERAPLQQFPRTAEGWNAAWAAFIEMEPSPKRV